MTQHKFKFLLPSLFFVIFLMSASSARAQVNLLNADIVMAASSSASEATPEGKLASASAETEKKIQEKKDQDITETGGKQKSKLAAYLDEHPLGDLSWHNPLQYLIRKAIENGVPANILVLVLLFPVIAAVISISRHVIGLKGFGIYIPAVLSVAFVSTGIIDGVLIFMAVLLSAAATRKVIRRLRLPLLPRTAMLLWGVSVFILFSLIGVSFLDRYIDFSSLLTINIFPILIIILLTENFMESQLFKSQKEALRITFQTLLIAVFCSFLVSSEIVQQFVILRPEMTLIAVAVANWIVGKYTGLRLLEYIRFKTLLRD